MSCGDPWCGDTVTCVDPWCAVVTPGAVTCVDPCYGDTMTCGDPWCAVVTPGAETCVDPCYGDTMTCGTPGTVSCGDPWCRDTMDELDVHQMQREVESLKLQLQTNREKSSHTLTELVKWIEEGVANDPFLNADLLRNNPWVESSKCVLL
ncbi:hypothetical protein ACEWY4_017501 [Coilia grayii]|uniref:G protein gamma domain-containing protein n=1 Tax=Coilia grayii TaxID=363190 RepID=A0ABD1JHB3_9TELE